MNITAHLLESTLFAAAAATATLLLRNNHARTRHRLWLAASVKFLLPFSLLVGWGTQIPWRTAPAAGPQVSIVMEDAGTPAVALPGAPAPQRADWSLAPLLYGLWLAGAFAILLRWAVRYSRVSAVLRRSRPFGSVSTIPVFASAESVEPAVFGVFRPALLLPEGIASALPKSQLDAVLAHELCHVRHRDNLSSALHMLVETIFWFHPLVWWIGARLLEERERACDEEVVLRGNDPEAYAEGILAVCRMCLQSPVPCVSGIRGADLPERIERIMAGPAPRHLDFARRFFLAALAAAAILGPLTIGLLRAPAIQAQQRDPAPLAFEVASVKPLPDPVNWPWPDKFSMTPTRSGGRITWVTAQYALIQYAYRTHRWQMQFPADAHESFFQIDAKTSESATDEQIRLMLQTILRERFHLAVHKERKEVNGYALKVLPRGPKIRPVGDNEEPPPMPEYFRNKPAKIFEGRLTVSKEGELAALTGRRVTMTQLADALQDELKTLVLDKTALAGKFYFGTKFVHPDTPRDVDGPSLFAALQEALGLKLEKQKGPVEMLVIEHVDRVPTGNQ
jgi:bla regulator protein blaR1